MKIIDTHAHLDQIEHLKQVLEIADKEDVESIVTMSVDAKSCRKNLEIKKTCDRPKIYIAFGMHPSDACLDRLDECIELIRKHKDELTAIGEIGLDFWYKWVRKDKLKKDEQRKIYRVLLELAMELNLPAVIHTRGTWRESFEIAKEIGIQKAEFHWYSGPVDVLKDILDSGFFISASPSLAYSPQSREAISYAPIERTMIETDSPVSYKSMVIDKEADSEERFQAQPKDVFRTLKAYCALKKVDEEKALDIFNNNAKEFFQLG